MYVQSDESQSIVSLQSFPSVFSTKTVFELSSKKKIYVDCRQINNAHSSWVIEKLFDAHYICLIMMLDFTQVNSVGVSKRLVTMSSTYSHHRQFKERLIGVSGSSGPSIVFFDCEDGSTSAV